MSIRIGLAVYEYRNRNIAFNLNQIEKALKAAETKTDLLCFGEAFLQGFDALSWDYSTDAGIAIAQDSSVMQQIIRMSVKYGVDLLLGYIESDGEKIYSSCAVIAGGKLIHNYRRISRGWKEYTKTDWHYCEGRIVESFCYKGQKFVIALCGDMWDYPERFKTDGILLWPVYISYDLHEWPQEEPEYAKKAASAAKEALIVNSLFRENEPFSHGGAFYVRSGEVVQKHPYDTEGIMTVSIL